jgi:glycosyltransferase involved in cell wall biosynthesis
LKILYCYPASTSFVRIDAQLLRKHFTVREFFFDGRKKWLTPWQFIRQFFHILVQSASASAYVCHFAGYHSFLPALAGKVFNRPCLIILAGTDCQSFPSFGYGHFQKPLLRRFTVWSLKMAAHLAPVHKSLVEYDYTYTADDFPKQGYKYFDPSIDTPFTEIPYGYDSRLFKRSEAPRILNSFLTVAQSLSPEVYRRKGIDLIVQVTQYFPDFTFTIVGADWKHPGAEAHPNVRFIAPVPYEELVTIYNRHEFYLQVSIAEGFPNALCEAMLCGCIPIGSAVAAIPLIIDHAGFILEKRDAALLHDLIKQAVAADRKDLSMKAHRRIVENFDLTRREQRLAELICSLCN